MLVIGAENLAPVPALHEPRAIILPCDRQHRERKAEGTSYEDNYVGNALASMIRRDAIEIRYHKSFTDRDVIRIVAALLTLDAFEPWRDANITYQGRPIEP